MSTLIVPEIYQVAEWFAVYVVHKHEKRVAQHFQVREIEYYLPLYEAQRKWKDGSKVTLQLPLFPGYIFARTPRDGRRRIVEAPGVLFIVGKPERSMISDSYMQLLRDGLHLRKAEPHPSLPIGKRVRIKSGALAGIEGVLVRKKVSLRVVLTVEAIMRSFAVEVGLDEVEPVHSGAEPVRPIGWLKAAG
jgi:transcriptional antiterminator NusG